MSLLQRFGIEIPKMYTLGYSHSNCIGCVKAANLSYWAAIREDFPKIFDWMAIHERNIGAKDDEGNRKGAAINKTYINGVRTRVFLDELPNHIEPKRDLEISCGYSCGVVGDFIEGRIESTGLDSIDGVFG